MTNTCQFCRVAHKATVPTIHMNGTAARELYSQFEGAVEALREFQRTVIEAAPNGRDYYPQGDGAIHAARRAHERRLRHLSDMLAEYEEMRDHVQAVLDYQAAQRASREVANG